MIFSFIGIGHPLMTAPFDRFIPYTCQPTLALHLVTYSTLRALSITGVLKTPMALASQLSTQGGSSCVFHRISPALTPFAAAAFTAYTKPVLEAAITARKLFPR